MRTNLTPEIVGEPQPAGQVVVEEALHRDPGLWVPGKKPVGKVTAVDEYKKAAIWLMRESGGDAKDVNGINHLTTTDIFTARNFHGTTFDGANDNFIGSNTTFGTFGDGSTDQAFSVLFRLTNFDLEGAYNGGPVAIISKDYGGSAREWALIFVKIGVNNWRLRLFLKDGSSGNQQSIDADYSWLDNNQITTTLLVTYDGSGGYGGMDYYKDGVKLAETNAVNQAYTAMNNKSSAYLEVGRYANVDTYCFLGRMDFMSLIPFVPGNPEELTLDPFQFLIPA